MWTNLSKVAVHLFSFSKKILDGKHHFCALSELYIISRFYFFQQGVALNKSYSDTDTQLSSGSMNDNFIYCLFLRY